MDVINPIPESSARHVSGRCLLNGSEVPFVSFSVESNAFTVPAPRTQTFSGG